VPILMAVAFVTIAERKVMAAMQRRCGPNAVGWWGLLQPFADALKLLVKEIIIPRQSNSFLFVIGPCITLVFALLGWAIIPFGEGLAIFDYDLGVFFALAVSSIGGYGILISGWAANSKYSFMGAVRATAQLLSYELVFSSIVLILIVFSGSFSLTYIVECQQAVWNIFPLMPIALAFFIAILAETNRPPFDLAEARFGYLKNILWCKVSIILFKIKYIICWKIYHFLIPLFLLKNIKYSIWKIITSKMLKFFSLSKEIVVNILQRLNMNDRTQKLSNFFVLIFWTLKIKSNILYYKIYLSQEDYNINDLFKVGLKFDSKEINSQKIYDNIHEVITHYNIRLDLKNSKGIYGFFCKVNHKLYIGSSVHLVNRFKEHIKGRHSNYRLQGAFSKYGLNNFYYVIFEYYNPEYENSLMELETFYLSKFKVEYLYNFKYIANSLLGYKHSVEALS